MTPPPSPTEPRVSDDVLQALASYPGDLQPGFGNGPFKAELAKLARDLLDARAEITRLRALLREIKQNIDENGPDRPDLYKRLCDLAVDEEKPNQ
jgi:hypothetical protein